VLGFCRDFKLRPLHYQIEPFALQIAGAIFVQPYIYIRIKQGCNIKEVTEYIRTALTEYFKVDNSGVDVLLLDDIMRNEYKEDEQKALQTSLFAIVAIIVSFMGLFATVLFEVKYMEREIALRRVNGATVPSIIMLINKKYLRMVSISFVIALPIAVYVVMMWLSNFAYRTEISWWIFAVVFLVITFLSALLVTVTAWRTANRNPIEVLNKG
jgi:putative ABC transport system permease protein